VRGLIRARFDNRRVSRRVALSGFGEDVGGVGGVGGVRAKRRDGGSEPKNFEERVKVSK